MALGPVPRVVVKVLPGARWRRGGLGVFRGAGSPVFSFLSRRQHRLSLAPSFLGRGNFHCQGSSHSRPTALYSGIKEIMKATVDPDSAEGRAEIDRLQHQILQIYQSLRGRLRLPFAP